MFQPDVLPDARGIGNGNAIPGVLSAETIGLLADNTLGANISVADRNYRLLYVNTHYARACLTTQDRLIGRTLFELHDEAQMRELEPHFQRVLAGETVTYVRLSRIAELDSKWVTVSLSPWLDASGEVHGIVLVSMRVHELKVNAEALRAANERLTSHIDNSPLAILELDRHLNVASCSAQFRGLIGLAGEPVVGTPLLDVLAAGDALQPLELALARLRSGDETRNRAEVALRHRSGAIVHTEWFNSALTDARGNVGSIMSLVQDTTARMLAEARLREIAMHDPLTGLSNRRALTERIENTLQIADCRLALLLIDLDGFKPINDAYGHAVGDDVLCEVARRLQRLTRDTDIVARVGGDEFVLLVSGETSVDSLATFAARIVQALEAPLLVNGLQVRVSASIGVAHYPHSAGHATELIRTADAAMYCAKRAGKGRVHFAPDHVTIK